MVERVGQQIADGDIDLARIGFVRRGLCIVLGELELILRKLSAELPSSQQGSGSSPKSVPALQDTVPQASGGSGNLLKYQI
jgi:hypothetical protein